MAERRESRWTARVSGVGAVAVAAALVFPGTGTAQAAEVDARWLPFLGCWESEGGPVQDALVCLRPGAGNGGVEVLTVVDGEITSSERLRADGEVRENRFEGCEGTDVARFSEDGRRVFTRSEYVCEGGVGRSSTGIIAMITPREWVDVESVDVEGEVAAWVTRYHLAHPDTVAALGLDLGIEDRRMAVVSARRAASLPLEVDDVIEASASVDEEVVRSWIAEHDDRFDLDADRLERLADAGVAPSVIDVVVAVSYPDRFALDRNAQASALPPEAGPVRSGYVGVRRGWFGSPFYWNSFYYSPFYSGYGGWGYPGYWGRGGWYSPGVVVVTPRGEGGGRVIAGQGYTRGRSSPSSSSSGTRMDIPTRRSSGSSGAMTSSGASKGSTSKSTGRKATRRGGGGGGGGGGDLLF